MDPITCPHPNCRNEWVPRKANPKKCPRCMNPLWSSPNPKRKTIKRQVQAVEFKPTEVPMADDEPSFKEEVTAMREWAKDLPPLDVSAPHQDPLAERKARAESLLARLI